ncbi:MAG: aminoacyl-tRNA hydrolase [Gammaproteobacteria bacterium]|jgi:PTH1 family peptidyl-tRNA hydrolase|nr:aminoacyl-tRNA hydrolase [Gammaproteobacteria bacterium]MBT4654859.1 aminoacyl-tRNA hydrolase [Gammaproteobacteria bacterium]MBT5116641.1 aminoacyl-tRNA hydrolase [Gammaproteobacteria bacterium]MBT5761732.1 aminoacyl-tRNA hydrolase [Gammaproteobacteria bacterium]MBT6331250.1 aminoacyl-tRNA hydrolase [Gammaproteobacteria bacterium]
MSLQLIVGLGNPDKKLLPTRHNVGFWFVDSLSEKLGKDFDYQKKIDSDIFQYEYQEKLFHIMKPLSYINNSGVPLKKFIKNKNIRPENILIVYDDLDLVAGKIRLKLGGGSGGHNGLNSIIEQLGSKNFWRLRIGIGKPEDKNRVIEYVLGKPSKEDKESIFESINLIINEMDGFFTGSSSTLMNKLNGDNK